MFTTKKKKRAYAKRGTGISDLERKRGRTETAQEIGPLPAIENPERREACRRDLLLYIQTYFSEAVYKGFAPYQIEMVAAFQDVILNGGKKARAVRRGGLKSTLARIAVAWAIDYGHRKFAVLTGATDDKSHEHRDNFLDMLKSSVTHLADFPETIPLLLKKANPKKMLRLNGKMLECTAKDSRGCILYPEIDGVESSQARIAPYSVLSTDVSGLSFVDKRGRTIRPDILVFDDVQTPQSARSFLQTEKRENAVCTTFMGLAALGETMAAIMVCTVREPDDLTIRVCDRKIHPDWDGRCFPILLHEPTHEDAKKLWAEYGLKLHQGETPAEGFAIATAHYVAHRAAMDEGAIVAWELDKEDDYVSAIQWCMTTRILQPDYFRCELQQDGTPAPTETPQLVAAELIKRLSNVARGVVPAQASYLTASVDSSDHVLWWMLCAWAKDYTGWIVDFGTWPNQGRRQFYKSDLQRHLEHELPGASWEEAFVNAHNRLDDFLIGQEWPVEGGGTRAVDLLLKDCSDGSHKPRIESQVSASKHKARIRPSKGFAPKPGKKPIHLYGDQQRDRHTFSHWVERRTESPVHVQFDTNIFKAHVARRLKTVVGAPSALVLPGSDERDLSLLVEHLTAETAKAIVYDGTPGIVYEQSPGRDNDWWDTTILNAVAASMLGCALPGETTQKTAERRKFVIPASRRAG